MSTVSLPSVVSTPAPRYITFTANRRGMRTVYDTLNRCPVITVFEDAAHAHAADLNAKHEATLVKLEPCWRCGTPCPSDAKSDPHHCPTCRRAQAEAAANELVSAAKAMRAGAAPFDVLTAEERAEQLEALGLAKPCCPSPADMMKLVRSLASDTLIDLAAHSADEIGRRLGSVEVHHADRHVEPSDDFRPTSELRREIEDQLEDEARELVLASEAAEQDAERFDGMA